MVEAISKWIVGVVATEALRQVAEHRDEVAVGGVWWQQTTTGPFAIGADDASRLQEEKVDELDRVEAEAMRLGGHPPSGPPPRDYTDRFSLDLSGWQHGPMVERSIAERRARDPGSMWLFDQMYDPVTVVVYRTLKNTQGALVAATWRNGFLTVWSLPSYLHRAREFRSYIDQLRRTIRHELQHLAQDLLREATGVDAAGGHRTRLSPHPDGLHPRDEHALRDVEFHTRLQDAIEEYGGGSDNASIRSYVNDGPVVHGVEPHDFFAALKRYDRRKWVRAVSEFLKAVGGRTSIPPVGSRYAHMPPSASRVASRFHVRSASADPREATVVEKIKRVIARITGYGVAANKQVTRDNAVMLDARRNQVVVRGADKLWATIESDVIVDSDYAGDLLAEKAAAALTRHFKVRFTVSQDLWDDYSGSYGFNVNVYDLMNAGGGGVTVPASSWVTSLADFIGKARIQRLTLDRGHIIGPYQTSNTTTEQSSVDIGPWLRSQGMSDALFASALSSVSARTMHPVGEHMGLREWRGAPIVRSNPVYSLSGDLLVLKYKETIYYN